MLISVSHTVPVGNHRRKSAEERGVTDIRRREHEVPATAAQFERLGLKGRG